MIKIGITGSMGSGKSTVSEIFRKSGIPVVSCDGIVNSLRSPGNVIWQEIRTRWPGRYTQNRRRLDTGKLRKDMLADATFKKEMEDMIHPLVKSEVKKILFVWEKEKIPAAAVEVPLLFEAGWEEIFDYIITAWAPEPVLTGRIQERSGLGGDEAARWLSLQMDQGEKKERSDYTVNTDKKKKITEKAVKEIIKKIKGENV